MNTAPAHRQSRCARMRRFWRQAMVATVAWTSICVAACASPEPAAPAGKTPEDAVQELYADEVFRDARNGLPADQLRRLRDRFTPELVERFESYDRDVARWLAEHKNETLKAPVSEGPVFISNYEGATRFSIGRAAVEGTRAEVPVALSYTEGAETVRWVDVAMLRLVDRAWLLDDIRFDPDGSAGETLRQRITLP